MFSINSAGRLPAVADMEGTVGTQDWGTSSAEDGNGSKKKKQQQNEPC